MKEKICNNTDITREEWLTYRRSGIGGSDAAVIVGLNPYRSRLELYADKIGLLPEKEDNEAMRIGRDLEQYVADRFCEETGKKVRRNNFMWAMSDYPFIRADVDREVVGENAGLECKTTNTFNKTDFEGGNIPLAHLCQVYHYMNVMGYDRMYLAELVMGKAFYWFCIERNEHEQNALLQAEIDFWNNHVLAGVEPAPDGSDSAQAGINAIFPNQKTEGEVMLHEYEKDLAYYAELKESIGQATKEADAVKQKIMLAIGDHSGGVSQKYRVSYAVQTRMDVDKKKLAAEFPDAYEACLKESISRVFRMKEIKAKEKKEEV